MAGKRHQSLQIRSTLTPTGKKKVGAILLCVAPLLSWCLIQ